MGKKKSTRGNLGKKKLKEQADFDRMIQSVTDAQVANFTCEIPSDKELDALNFPNVVINPPPLNDFKKLRAQGEWAADWLQLLIVKQDELDELGVDFSKLPEEDQNEHRNQMMENMRKSNRSLKWRKYQYALQNKSQGGSVVERNEAQSSGSVVGSKEEEDFGEEEAEDFGEEEAAEASGSVVESKEEDFGDEKEAEASGSVVGSKEGFGEEEAEASGGVVGSKEGFGEEVAEASGGVVGSKEGFGEEEAEVSDFARFVGEGKDFGEEVASGDGGLLSQLETREPFDEKLLTDDDDDVIEKLSMDVGREDEIGLGLAPANPFMCRFPCFEDGDNVRQYTQPFSLLDWFNKHRTTDSRYLPHVPNNLGWSDVNWNGDRLRRESLGVIHSVLSSVLDYHEQNGSHGNIEDHANIMLCQYVVSFGGSQKIQYHIELPRPIKSEDSSDLRGLCEDMRQVKLIFEKVLAGRDINSEMDFLLSSLMGSYPFIDKDAWKNKLLRNCPSMWDGKARANFIVNFYYNWTSDSQKYEQLNRALLSVGHVMNLSEYGFNSRKWIKKIPSTSTFYEILTFELIKVPETQLSSDVNPPSPPPVPQYTEGELPDILRYSRAVLDHHRQTKGVGLMDINYIELCLSNLFKSFITGLYMGMCSFNVFFN